MRSRLTALSVVTALGVAQAGGAEAFPPFIGSGTSTPIGTPFCNIYHCRYLGWYTGENMFVTYTVRGYRLNTGALFEVAWTSSGGKSKVYNLRLTAKLNDRRLLADYILLSTNRTQIFDPSKKCALLKYPVPDRRNYASPAPVFEILKFSSLPLADGGYNMEFNCGRHADDYRLVARGGGSDTYWFDAATFKAGQP